MMKPSNTHVMLWSIAGSGLVNAFLFSSAFAGSAGGKKSLFVRLADMVAAPPGFIATQMFAPKEHTSSAFAAAAVASLICSFLFYAIVFWLILHALLLFQSTSARAR
jgi:uncharacterized membrane protein YdbT with pleckstrin-like domain